MNTSCTSNQPRRNFSLALFYSFPFCAPPGYPFLYPYSPTKHPSITLSPVAFHLSTPDLLAYRRVGAVRVAPPVRPAIRFVSPCVSPRSPISLSIPHVLLVPISVEKFERLWFCQSYPQRGWLSPTGLYFRGQPSATESQPSDVTMLSPFSSRPADERLNV